MDVVKREDRLLEKIFSLMLERDTLRMEIHLLKEDLLVAVDAALTNHPETRT